VRWYYSEDALDKLLPTLARFPPPAAKRGGEKKKGVVLNHSWENVRNLLAGTLRGEEKEGTTARWVSQIFLELKYQRFFGE
jgi:hypothetical protein